ncbi:hypothetical protein L195_g051324 [Trifolium pratense]|uniref:Uncharacterized protein n=1 Tax=Trifolium pratense TaxID=57577 RepID=A0A2K3JYZ9_TRIPR|nr:hypothetical protein L195_g051324 [Trifolium pratense]
MGADRNEGGISNSWRSVGSCFCGGGFWSQLCQLQSRVVNLLLVLESFFRDSSGGIICLGGFDDGLVLWSWVLMLRFRQPLPRCHAVGPG